MHCTHCHGDVAKLEARVAELEDQLVGLTRELVTKSGDNTRLRNELEQLKGAGEDALAPVVHELFDHWRERCGHPRARLDKKRFRAIAARLKDGYSADDVRQAINGVAKFPYVVDGQRSSTGTAKQRFDDIELVCRNAGNLERFAALGVGTIERSGMRSKLVGA